MIETISFDEIYHIWRNDLWPERISEITPSSAMCYMGGYDVENMKNNPIFIAYKKREEIRGVNSLHLCIDGSYRSRGLFVYPKFRGEGIGIKLLIETINLAKEHNATFVWSYPKQASWKTYQHAGFSLSSPWETSELGFNAYCVKHL